MRPWRKRSVPTGRDFLRLIWRLDEKVQRTTDKRIAKLGRKAPGCFAGLGTAQTQLHLLASCFYGCRGGDHVIEYLSGRVCGLARSSIRLLRFGFYDEALTLTRSVGEIANLVQLFELEGGAFTEWKSSTRVVRLRKYGPAAVRKRLEELGASPGLTQDWYGLICERATHPTPLTKPNAFNPIGVPLASPQVQDAGVLVCLNELGQALCHYIVHALALLNVDKDIRLGVLNEVRSLAENLGGVTLNELPNLWVRHETT